MNEVGEAGMNDEEIDKEWRFFHFHCFIFIIIFCHSKRIKLILVNNQYLDAILVKKIFRPNSLPRQ